MEKMHAMLTEMYEDRQRQPGSSELTGVSTGKRKMRTEDVVDGDEEGETSLSLEPGAGQDRIKFKKLELWYNREYGTGCARFLETLSLGGE
uniref:Gypsy/ty3 element polyprotein n=1 Tax=Cucumis melo TaxID=3656 RepID=A0A9I9E4B7_CUCME